MTYMQMYMQVFFDWVIRASLMASVLVVLIVLLKWVLKNQLQPKWQYLLWLPVVFRLLLPWAPESQFSLYNLFPVKQHLLNESLSWPLEAPLGNQIMNTMDSSSESTLPDQSLEAAVPEKQVSGEQSVVNLLSGFPIKETVMYLWLLGVIALSFVTGIANIKVYKRMKQQPHVSNHAILHVFVQCKQQMSIHQPILLTVTDAVPSPAVFGFWKPRILLSSSLIRSMDVDQFQFVFNHELAHIKRRDVVMNWLMHVLVIFHWFNPMMWYAYSRMRVDQEVACDALALSYIDSERKTEYGQTVIHLLEHFAKARRYPGLVGLSSNNKQLKRRILMIKHFKKNSIRLSAIGLATVLTVCAVSLVNAQGAPAATAANAAITNTPVQVANSSSAQGVQEINYNELIRLANGNDPSLILVLYSSPLSGKETSSVEALKQDAQEKGINAYVFYWDRSQPSSLSWKWDDNDNIEKKQLNAIGIKGNDEHYAVYQNGKAADKTYIQYDQEYKPGEFYPIIKAAFHK